MLAKAFNAIHGYYEPEVKWWRRDLETLADDYAKDFTLYRLWTGFELQEALKHPVRAEILNKVDTIIDGKFVKELADPSLTWRGSSNQVIYDRVGTEFVRRAGVYTTIMQVGHDKLTLNKGGRSLLFHLIYGMINKEDESWI